MADEKKKFRVILKDQINFVVKAHHFQFDSRSHICVFYKSESEEDPDIAIVWSEVRAIIPED
jgi:hypothetical protein